MKKYKKFRKIFILCLLLIALFIPEISPIINVTSAKKNKSATNKQYVKTNGYYDIYKSYQKAEKRYREKNGSFFGISINELVINSKNTKIDTYVGLPVSLSFPGHDEEMYKISYSKKGIVKYDGSGITPLNPGQVTVKIKFCSTKKIYNLKIKVHDETKYEIITYYGNDTGDEDVDYGYTCYENGDSIVSNIKFPTNNYSLCQYILIRGKHQIFYDSFCTITYIDGFTDNVIKSCRMIIENKPSTLWIDNIAELNDDRFYFEPNKDYPSQNITIHFIDFYGYEQSITCTINCF